MSRGRRGAVAAGHPKTVEAATHALREGGNAFDAVLAAQFAATAVEPVLTSLGGGGFMLAHPENHHERVYDFFVHTPRQRHSRADDIRPVVADFGPATQEFHIGAASIATPGMVKGLLRIHRDLGSLPLRTLLEPAIDYARRGIRITALQHYLSRVVAPILAATPGSRTAFLDRNAEPIRQGALHRQADLADTLEALAREGADLFYRGEIARSIVQACRDHGGHLGPEDLRAYRVLVRRPLRLRYRGARISTNPLPSIGGPLIAFAFSMLESLDPAGLSEARRLMDLAAVMELTNDVRGQSRLDDELPSRRLPRLLQRSLLSRYRCSLLSNPVCSRGTTHISVIDDAGNAAAMTTSNGEGSGLVVPGTGIMMNNMLGEEDINPGGPGHWPCNRRMGSMMAPTLLHTAQGDRIALGSGGSNRIRSAILQTLINVIDLGMDLPQAVSHPRIHYERGRLSVEAGIADEVADALAANFSDIHLWTERNLFFGGVHAVRCSPDAELSASGDPRRGGAALVIG